MARYWPAPFGISTLTALGRLGMPRAPCVVSVGGVGARLSELLRDGVVEPLVGAARRGEGDVAGARQGVRGVSCVGIRVGGNVDVDELPTLRPVLSPADPAEGVGERLTNDTKRLAASASDADEYEWLNRH